MKQIWNWIRKHSYLAIFIFWWLMVVVAIFVFHVFSAGGGADWDNNPWAAPWNMGGIWIWLFRLLVAVTFIFIASVAAAFTSFLYYIMVRAVKKPIVKTNLRDGGIYCPICGQQNSKDASICETCGSKLSLK